MPSVHFSDQGTQLSSPSLPASWIKATSVYLRIQIQTASSNPIQPGAGTGQEKPARAPPPSTSPLGRTGQGGDWGLPGSELGGEELGSEKRGDCQSLENGSGPPTSVPGGNRGFKRFRRHRNQTLGSPAHPQPVQASSCRGVDGFPSKSSYGRTGPAQYFRAWADFWFQKQLMESAFCLPPPASGLRADGDKDWS